MWDSNIISTDYFLLCLLGSGLCVILLVIIILIKFHTPFKQAGTIYSICLRLFFKRKHISGRQNSNKGTTTGVLINLNKNQPQKNKNGNPGIGGFKSQESQQVKKPKRTLSLSSMTRRSSVAKVKPPIGTGFYTTPSVDAPMSMAMTMDPMGFDQVFSSADWMSGYLYALQFHHVAVIMEEQGQGQDLKFTTNMIHAAESSSTASSSSSTPGNIKLVTLNSESGNHMLGSHNTNAETPWNLTSPVSPTSFFVKPYPIPVFGMMQCSPSMSEVHVDSGHFDITASDNHQADYSADHCMDMDMTMDFGDGGAAAGF